MHERTPRQWLNANPIDVSHAYCLPTRRPKFYSVARSTVAYVEQGADTGIKLHVDVTNNQKAFFSMIAMRCIALTLIVLLKSCRAERGAERAPIHTMSGPHTMSGCPPHNVWRSHNVCPSSAPCI